MDPAGATRGHGLGLGHVVGRYALFDEIGHGGMASVHLGRMLGPVGFARTVAIKRLHPQHAKDPDFAAMFLDEARLAARIRHPNVVQTLDIVTHGSELLLVLEYVQGESLLRLLRAVKRRGENIPVPYAVAIVTGVLQGLHAAHEARSDGGAPLGIVHRDVSPQNIMVGVDGVPRVLDFGIARAAGQVHTTREGQLKGKMGYMAPEQLRGEQVDRRTDVYAAGVVLWEALVGRRCFAGENEAEVFGKVLQGGAPRPSEIAPDVPVAIDDIVGRALSSSPGDRFATAREMARALEGAVPLVSQTSLGEWVEATAEGLSERMERVSRVEAESSGTSHVTAGAIARPVAVSSAPGDGGAWGRRATLAAAGGLAASIIVATVVWRIVTGHGDAGPAAAGGASAAASAAASTPIAVAVPSAPPLASAPAGSTDVVPSAAPSVTITMPSPPAATAPPHATSPAWHPQPRPAPPKPPSPSPTGLDGVLDTRH
ncbi:MAG TPA: serine/threonine-protein kinase [Polyangiaceae bacterium]